MLKKVLAVSFTLAVLCGGVSARLQPRRAEFTAQGLELLEGRYGQAYPGYGSNIGPNMDMNLGVGATNVLPSSGVVGLGQTYGLGQQFAPQQLGLAQTQFAQQTQFVPSTSYQANTQYVPQTSYQASTQYVPQLNYAAQTQYVQQEQQQQKQQQFQMQPQMNLGGVGSFGLGQAQMGGSKKTTVAAPIYAQSMVVPKVITQPIMRMHSVTQPIIQQQLIQQPIVETRQVIQPVIRRIITQPIIRPEIYESTTIQPTLKTETTVQPHIIQQTVVTPTVSNQYEENAPIQEAARLNVGQTVVQPTVSAKKGGGGLGFSGMGYGHGMN